jgi:hypothetical protein
MDKLKLVAEAAAQNATGDSGPAIARIVDMPATGIALVRINGESPLEARLVADLSRFKPEVLLGQEVVLLFERNDPERPIAIALLQEPSEFSEALQFEPDADDLDARVDGKHVVIEASKKLELRVGKASIVIDELGKITIRGAHLLNRATGPIRIKGGHVDIN